MRQSRAKGQLIRCDDLVGVDRESARILLFWKLPMQCWFWLWRVLIKLQRYHCVACGSDLRAAFGMLLAWRVMLAPAASPSPSCPRKLFFAQAQTNYLNVRCSPAMVSNGPCLWAAGVLPSLGDRHIWRRLAPQIRAVPKGVAWDLQQMVWLDHIGAQLLWEQWGRTWPARLLTTKNQRSMLERVARFSEVPEAKPEPSGWMCEVNRLGQMVIDACGHFSNLIQLVGQLLLDCLRLLRNPFRGPWRDISGHLYATGRQPCRSRHWSAF